MPFSVVLLLLFSFATTGTKPATQMELEIFGQNSAAVRAIPASEQSGTPKNDRASDSRRSGKRIKQENPAQTLTGMVEWEYKPLAWDCDVPNCDHFALYDDATHTNYELDDARAALPYEGKRAKVTGVVDIKKSTIHLLSIEALK
jgi:hypothetical protein